MLCLENEFMCYVAIAIVVSIDVQNLAANFCKKLFFFIVVDVVLCTNF